MKILAISYLTFKEAVKNKIFYILVFFAFFLIFISIFVGKVAIGAELKVIKDMGLFIISFFGLLIAIVITIDTISKEIQRRTIYLILSKAISRTQFVLGKFSGISLILLTNMFLMTLWYFFILSQYGENTFLPLIYALALIFFELMLISAISLFFSSFTTGFLSGLFTFCIYLIGHSLDNLKLIAYRIEHKFLEKLLLSIYYIFPNLSFFDLKKEVVYNFPISLDSVIYPIIYGIAWILLFLIFSIFLFQRKNL